jgi:hypothetical protein
MTWTLHHPANCNPIAGKTVNGVTVSLEVYQDKLHIEIGDQWLEVPVEIVSQLLSEYASRKPTPYVVRYGRGAEKGFATFAEALAFYGKHWTGADIVNSELVDGGEDGGNASGLTEEQLDAIGRVDDEQRERRWPTPRSELLRSEEYGEYLEDVREGRGS